MDAMDMQAVDDGWIDDPKCTCLFCRRKVQSVNHHWVTTEMNRRECVCLHVQVLRNVP